MISTNKKFLFIHVPKTGGNSIQNILKEYSDDYLISPGKHQDGIERFDVRNKNYKTLNKHSPISAYKRTLDSQVYSGLFKFATIRNPWDRCISFYFSPHRTLNNKVEWSESNFKRFIRKIDPIRNSINTKYGKNSNELDANIDFLIKFENLSEDFKKVCDIIDIPFGGLPHRNKNLTNKKHYTNYYTDELIELVKTKFSEEINWGNYKYGE